MKNKRYNRERVYDQTVGKCPSRGDETEICRDLWCHELGLSYMEVQGGMDNCKPTQKEGEGQGDQSM